MKVTDVIKLMGNGFNAEQIEKLQGYKLDDINQMLEAKMTPDSIISSLSVLDKEEKAPEGKPEGNPEAKEPEEKPEGKPEGSELGAITEQIKALTQAIQASNINLGNGRTPAPEQSLEEIGQSIFAGPQDKGENKNG